MQAKNNILSIEQSNRNMLRHYSKSCNRSENRHLIYYTPTDIAQSRSQLESMGFTNFDCFDYVMR